MEVTYNPAVITYEKLLEVFWDSHTPDYPVTGQYASIILFHDADQESAARKSLAAREAELGTTLFTSIKPAAAFYQAEDYHQKYYLQMRRNASDILYQLYPDYSDFVRSTASARLNGLAGGDGDTSGIVRELCGLKFSESVIRSLLGALGKNVDVTCVA